MALAESAWLAAYRRLEKPLYNVLYRRLWNRQDCEDLIHDAFLRVWARRDAVREADIDALLYATALNLSRNRLRWRSLWRFVAIDADAASGDDPQLSAEAAQDEMRLRRALQSLSAGERDVLLLSEYAGLGTREIAGILSIAEGTVGSRKHQARARLRQALGGDDG